MTGNVVYVCSGKSDSSCKECGRVTERVSQKQWAAIECNGGTGIQGRYVKVAATNSYLQLTEVEIFANGLFPFLLETDDLVRLSIPTQSDQYLHNPV